MKSDSYLKSLISILIIFPLLWNEVKAQNDIPLGSWRMHISYRQAKDVAIAENDIFCSTENGLFYFSRDDNSINTLTKLEGLSDNNISEISYSQEKDLLFIGYVNGNMDFLSENQIINFPIIKNSNFQDKRINHSIFWENIAFISTDFGVVAIDMNRMDIKESYLNLGENGEILQINYATIYHDSLFLATAKGVIAGTLDPGINLQDFNNWKRFQSIDGIPSSEVNSLAVYQNILYAAISKDGIYEYVEGAWLKIEQLQNTVINNISAESDWMTISTDSSIWIMEDDIFIENKTISITPQIALFDTDGKIWIADYEQGLRTDFDVGFTTIKPSGPNSNSFFKLFYRKNKIIGLSGGYDKLGEPLENSYGFYVFEDGKWSNYSTPEFDLPSDLVDIDYDQLNQKYIITSFKDGYVEWDGNEVLSWIKQNSQNYPFNSSQLTAVHFEEKLWVSGYEMRPSVYSQGMNGSWIPLDLNQPGETHILQITSDLNGNIWFRVDPNSTAGIIVYNPDTDISEYLANGSGNGGLPSKQVNELEVDLQGNVWVATDQGVAYYPSGAFQPGQVVDAVRPILDGRFLFNNEKVNTIRTDGGNRKWIGTEIGLWLVSEFGDELITHFTIDNSPLLSNSVFDIEINSSNGEVFVATDQGVSSFRSDASLGEDSHASEVKIFPNPITSDFNGIVGFEGLAANAFLKITDVSGRLVWQMQANGGSASWNLSTIYGGRPSSGIYLVYSSTEDGSDTYVGKFAIIE